MDQEEYTLLNMVRDSKRSSGTLEFLYARYLSECNIPVLALDDSYRLLEERGLVEHDRWGNWEVTEAGELALLNREHWEVMVEEIVCPQHQLSRGRRSSRSRFRPHAVVVTVLRGQVFEGEAYTRYRRGRKIGGGTILTVEAMSDLRRPETYSLTIYDREPKPGDTLKRVELRFASDCP